MDKHKKTKMLGPKRFRKTETGKRRTSLMVNLSYVKNIEATDSDNGSKSDYENISGKEQELNNSCNRLKEAILSKTREIFDKQNDFCLRTATILEQPCSSNSSSDDKPSELNKKKSKNNLDVKENNPGNSQEIKNNVIKVRGSPILASSNFNSCNSTILLPKKNSIGSDINLDGPVTSSTFVNYSCSTPILPKSKKQKRLLAQVAIDEEEEEASTSAAKTSKPSVTNVRTCYIALDRIEGLKKNNASKNLAQVSMELTEVQGNTEEKEKNNSEIMEKIEKDLQDKYDKNHGKIVSAVTEVLGVSDRGCSKRSAVNSKNSTSDRESLKVNTSLEVAANEKSFEVVEGTPVVSKTRSLRSQLKSGSSKTSQEKDKEEENNATVSLPDKPAVPTEKKIAEEKEKDNLDDTLKLNVLSSSSNKAPLIIDESSSDVCDDEMSDKDVKQVPNKIKKRKLFSQFNTSDIATISPALSGETPPVNRTPPRVVKKKRIRRNIAGRIIGTQAVTNTRPKREKKIIEKYEEPQLKKIKKTQTQAEEKKPKKKRNVVSKKIVVKKMIVGSELSKIFEESDSENQESQASQNSKENSKRSSINNFMKKKIIDTKGRNYKNEKIFIVTTGLSNRDKELVKSAVKKIPGAKIENSVTRQTTHVVTTGVRTINLLRGIIRGCWLVNLMWIKKSMEAKRWLNTETFEIDHFSKAVEENRKERQIFGRSFVPELFTTCGLIYVDEKTNPPKEILKELIKTAGGRVIEDPKKAKILIGPSKTKEIWLLDSITTGKVQSIDQYQRENKIKTQNQNEK